MQIFAALPLSKQLLVVALLLALLVCLSDSWFYRHGYILLYGDAQAHLNISRSILDSRTPGYDQIGTVWLPVLHVICLPFVMNNAWWSSGLAGTIPVSICFVLAGTLLFAAARDAYQDALSAAIVTGCFALNPNLLYLAAAPMTEIVFLAGFAALLLALGRGWFALAVPACWWMALTRYDGWFLIPFAAAAFASQKRRLSAGVWFAVLASLAPLYWIGHNWFETSNPFDFFNGPYSAKAIQGNQWYPGLHNWLQAGHYYWKAGQLCSGWQLLILGIAGFFCISNGRMLKPASLLALTPLFYIWSMHSSGNPVRVPQLWPHDYYNSRYGIAVAVWAAFASGAIVTVLPWRWRNWSPVVILLAVLPWIFSSRQGWIVWKESEVNSRSRLAWTRAAGDFMKANYRMGQGITASFGDLTGIFSYAQIPLGEVLHEGNGPLWLATRARPDLLHTTVWAITQGRNSLEPAYRIVREIDVKGAPPLFLLKRRH